MQGHMAASIDTRPPAIFLMGVTASGKTDLAIALADRFPLCLISADSALVYKGLDIGSAKPDPAMLARYPHALVDIRAPNQTFSAGDFRKEALMAMAATVKTGRTPLVVGGTGLYFRALANGLAPLPSADSEIRIQMEDRARRDGWPALHAELAVVDPDAASRIRPSDPQRIQRALEVWQLTGIPLSQWQRQTLDRFPYRLLKLALLPGDRGVVHARIERRFDAMLAAGFLDEVRALRSDPRLHAELPAIRAVGYRQAWRHLDGATDPASFRREAIAATRQLAKRQFTWFRAERDAFVIDPFVRNLLTVGRRYVADFLGPK